MTHNMAYRSRCVTHVKTMKHAMARTIIFGCVMVHVVTIKCSMTCSIWSTLMFVRRVPAYVTPGRTPWYIMRECHGV